MLIFQQIKFIWGKCVRNQALYMRWIEIALIYSPLILISSLEQKKALFNVKYEIVLRTPYSKARWGGGWVGGHTFVKLFHIFYRTRVRSLFALVTNSLTN